MKNQTIIIGGGTFSHIRNHMSLAAPAFGNTAREMYEILKDTRSPTEAVDLVLTKMADPTEKDSTCGSGIVTNEDLSQYIDGLLLCPDIKTIILNAAVCDYNGVITNSDGTISNVQEGAHAQRLKTAEGDAFLRLTPSDKIIARIRKERPDIFLVGFKTTTNATEEDQFFTALKMMKSTKCNLVLANDVVTRRNMIITPEETKYSCSTDRKQVLITLCDMITKRHRLTYHHTAFEQSAPVPMGSTPFTFQTVVKFLVNSGGFIENNGNGFTPGHFCWMDRENGVMLSSQRKANHNQVFDTGRGLTTIELPSDPTNIIRLNASGDKKPSVGSTSQLMLLSKFDQFDCVVHTHNPLTQNCEYVLPIRPQYAFQCGSIECGMNTVSGIKTFTYKGTNGNFKDVEIGVVYLDKHGANILFKSTDDPVGIIDFIKNYIELGVKVI